MRLIRQANAGKPAALNNGIRHARHELIVMIDGDTVFEPSTVRHLVQPFARPEVGAVSGNAKVANRSKLIGRWQHIEYVIGFNIDRRVIDLLRCMTTIPGAVGAFRRSALLQVGGVSDDTLAEDTDLTMAICAAGWRVVYEENARAWTEAPATFRQLWRQRYRWSYGTMQSMWKHRRAIFASGAAGRMGRVGLANLALFQVLLPCLAPLIDVFLIYGLLVLDPVTTLMLWAAVLVLQMLVAAARVRHGAREALAGALDAAPAARLPADDVRRADQVDRHRAGRRPAALAEAQASRRVRRPVHLAAGPPGPSAAGPGARPRRRLPDDPGLPPGTCTGSGRCVGPGAGRGRLPPGAGRPAAVAARRARPARPAHRTQFRPPGGPARSAATAPDR